MNLSTIQKIAFVDLARQYHTLKPEIDEAIQKVLDNTDFINGAAVKEFSTRFAAFCGVQYCVPCGNGTDALEIGLKALGIGAGDEVIVPANSFVASAEAVNNVNGTVVFCDCHPESYNIDPAMIELCITSRTKAIMAVHLYGRMADMNAIMEIARRHNLKVIEDASQAHGATYEGKKAGQFGAVSVFSFYPGKNLGAYGDGGAIVTDDEALFIQCKKIANHGRIAKYNHEIVGRNSRLDTIQAAVLNVKLPHLVQWNTRRYDIARQYHNALSHVKEIVLPKDFENEKSVYHLYVIRVEPSKRDALRAYLKEKGIDSGIHYPIALPALEAYQYMGHKPPDFPRSYQYMSEMVSLPIFPEMKDEEVLYVAKQVKEFFHQ